MNWKNEVLGLDIGTSAVKIVQLRRSNGSYQVTAAGIVDIAPEPGSDSEREINTLRAIHRCVQASAAETKLVVCGVCGPEVAVRDFEFPPLPAEEIEGAVMLEATQVCPFNIDDGAVDYQLTGREQERLSGVLVSATNGIIKTRIALAKKASLNCVMMDVDGLALLNCFNGCERPRGTQTTAILNVGGSYTTLAIEGRHGLPFVRDIAYAGNAIVKQMAAENNTSVETVKGILFGDSRLDQMELHDSLQKACDKLLVDVSQTLEYYQAQGKSAALERISVCGGFSLVKGFVELLNGRLRPEVDLWNPFDKIGYPSGKRYAELLSQNGPCLAVAAGLAMRTI